MAVEERPWGRFETLVETEDYKIKKITVDPHQRLSLQKHLHRSESWTVVSGRGHVVNHALVQTSPKGLDVKVGKSITIPVQNVHRMENRHDEPLVFIEVQTGESFDEDDIIRFQDDYGRE